MTRVAFHRVLLLGVSFKSTAEPLCIYGNEGLERENVSCGHMGVAGSGQDTELLMLPLSKFTSCQGEVGQCLRVRVPLGELGGMGELQGTWRTIVSPHVGLRNSDFSP